MVKKLEVPKPQIIKREKLEEIANETKAGMNAAIVLALADGKARTEKEIEKRVEKIVITACIEVNRREGLLEVKPKNFGWFTEWSVKLKRMKCPSCGTIWEVSKTRDSGRCPICNLNLIRLAEVYFPKLKKLARKKK